MLILIQIQKRQAAELLKMQEQAEVFKTAYEEKIRRLEKEKNELNRMDSKSSAARDLRSKIQRDEADVAQTKAALDEQENTLGKKFKSTMQCSSPRDSYSKLTLRSQDIASRAKSGSRNTRTLLE